MKSFPPCDFNDKYRMPFNKWKIYLTQVNIKLVHHFYI